MESRKVIIAGSRDLTLAPYAISEIVRLAGYETSSTLAWIDDKPLIEQVVCGKAKGIDTSGEEWAHTAGVKVVGVPAHWELYGRAAGPIRNKKMADYADDLILVWDGKSTGSASMKSIMLGVGKPVYEVVFKGWS